MDFGPSQAAKTFLAEPSASTVGFGTTDLAHDLAITFASSGAVKVFATDWFMAMDAWPADVPRGLLISIGMAEFAGVLGVVLPRMVGIQPRLTVFAALGLLLIMVFASGFHAIRGEWEGLPLNAAIGGVAAFVAWGRWRLAP